MKIEVKGLVLFLGIFIFLIIGMGSVSALYNEITYSQNISLYHDGLAMYASVHDANAEKYVQFDRQVNSDKERFQLIPNTRETRDTVRAVMNGEIITIKSAFNGAILEAETNVWGGSNDWIKARSASYPSRVVIQSTSEEEVIRCGDEVYFIAEDNENYFWDVQLEGANKYKVAADGSPEGDISFYIYNADGHCTCVPECEEALCGDADGCGGTCQDGMCDEGICINGECIINPGNSCEEEGDEGIDATIQGTVSGVLNGETYSFPDYCLEDEDVVNEFYCISDEITGETTFNFEDVPCTPEICSEGACVAPTVECTIDDECEEGFCGANSMMCLPSTVTCVEGQKIGDLNGDETIDTMDLDLIIGILDGKVDEPSNICCVDINRNGRINAVDEEDISEMINDPEGDYGVCASVCNDDGYCDEAVGETNEECPNECFCNNNETCDIEAGETLENCPNDCFCVPQCEGKACGDDSCDGTCGDLDGECEEGICSEGICVDSLVGETFCEFESLPEQINVSERLNELNIICYNETATNPEFVDCPNITNPESFPSSESDLSLLDFKYSQRKNSTPEIYGGKYYLTYNLTGKAYGVAWIYTNLTDSSLLGPLNYDCSGEVIVTCVTDSNCLDEEICEEGVCIEPDEEAEDYVIPSCSSLSRGDCSKPSKWTREILEDVESFSDIEADAGFCTDNPYEEEISPTCTLSYGCGCVWYRGECVGNVEEVLINLTADGCDEVEEEEEEIGGLSGRCQQSAPTIDGDCTVDDMQIISVTSSWVPSSAVPSEESLSYSFYDSCTEDSEITREIPCPPKTDSEENLPFFGMFNLIIAGIAIVMGYFMINARRRK